MNVAERDRALYSGGWLFGALFLLSACVKQALFGGAYAAAVLALCCAALLWRATLCAAAAREACLRVGEEWVSVSGVSGIFLRKMRVPRGKIAQIKIVRLPFIGSQPLCSVYIRPAGARRGLWCCFLPAERASALMERVR